MPELKRIEQSIASLKHVLNFTHKEEELCLDEIQDEKKLDKIIADLNRLLSFVNKISGVRSDSITSFLMKMHVDNLNSDDFGERVKLSTDFAHLTVITKDLQTVLNGPNGLIKTLKEHKRDDVLHKYYFQKMDRQLHDWEKKIKKYRLEPDAESIRKLSLSVNSEINWFLTYHIFEEKQVKLINNLRAILKNRRKDIEFFVSNSPRFKKRRSKAKEYIASVYNDLQGIDDLIYHLRTDDHYASILAVRCVRVEKNLNKSLKELQRLDDMYVQRN